MRRRWRDVPAAALMLPRALWQQLGGFEVPKLVHFVDALPATATGKVQKNVLRKML